MVEVGTSPDGMALSSVCLC